MGIGTPSNKSKIERMVSSVDKCVIRSLKHTLDGNNMISLPAPDGRGDTRTERAD
jgi:hypothetical protein